MRKPTSEEIRQEAADLYSAPFENEGELYHEADEITIATWEAAAKQVLKERFAAADAIRKLTQERDAAREQVVALLNEYGEAAKRTEEDGSSDEGRWFVYNKTDNIPAFSQAFDTREEAEKACKAFRERFSWQGYYLTSAGERIDPDDVLLVVQEN